MIYELREYRAVEGRDADLHDRFANHTFGLFERHGLPVVGYWIDPADQTRIVYLLRFPDQDTRDRAWSAFGADPEWKSVKAASEANGPIVAEISSTILTNPDYWPHETTSER